MICFTKYLISILTEFEPFNRLDKEGGDIEGTGIGLTIGKKIIEMLDSEIGYKSRGEEGGDFWVDVPLNKHSKSNVDELNSRPEMMTKIESDGDKKVLYVEDNPANLKLMKSALSRLENLELYTATDAEAGLDIAFQEPMDLVLMDINLPGMNGVEAMKMLRENKSTSHIPVIAVTANAMKSDIESGKQEGFEDYLTKPLDINKTLELVVHYLTRD